MKTVVNAWLGLNLLFCIPAPAAEPPTPPAATNLQTLRVVVLPFQNATGDTNWNDWQLALPGLIKWEFNAAEFTSVIDREKKMQALQRAGWTAGHEVDAKLAGQVALDLHANVVVWGNFQRGTNQWIVEAKVLNVNSSNGPVQFEVASSGWVRMPELVATNVAGHLNRPIAERDLQYSAKYLTDSEPALKLLARAINLDDQKQPAAEETVLRQLLAEDPRCGLAHILLTGIYSDKEARTNELAQAVHEFVQQCPDLCDAHLQNARLIAHSHDAAGAKRELLEAFRLHPDCPQASRAWFMFMGGVEQQWDEVRKVLEQTHTARPNDLNTTILLACARSQCGDRKGAHELLTGMSDLPDEDDIVDIALLVASAATGEYDLAGRELTRLGPQTSTNENIRNTLETFEVIQGEVNYGSSNAPIAKPRAFTAEELNAELDRRLTADERKLVVNPVEITPEITAEARRLTVGLTNATAQTIALFAEVARLGRGEGDGGSRTASQAQKESSDPQTGFSCQEYAKLFVALARSLGMDSWIVHIDRDAHGDPGYHDCAVVFLNGSGILVDPTWRGIGIHHQEIKVLDDLQAISHQAMQLIGTHDPNRLRMGLKLNPEDHWTQLMFVRGMIRAGELAAAEEELQQAQKTGVETWDVHEAAGELEIGRKHGEQALAELQRALEFSPSNAMVHYELAQAYSGLHDNLKATEHMEAALRFDRGEMPKELRLQTSSEVSAMKTVHRSSAGDASARADLQRMAEAGDVIAQFGMADAYFKERQFDDGLNWLLKAAGQGDAQAQFDYARILAQVHPDAGKDVIKWLTRAAQQGHLDAQCLLGKLLYYGKIVPGDNVAAGQWILLASNAGNTEAKWLWKDMQIFLTAGELAEAQKRAAEFKPVIENSNGKIK